MSSKDYLIRICNLEVDYKLHFWEKRKNILNNISFEIKTGQTTGLIGKNGAGKTTIIKTVLKLIKPLRGTIEYNFISKDFREEIGYLPELPYFYDHLTAKETLVFFAKLFKWNSTQVKAKVEAVIETLKLAPFVNSRIRKLSKGQQQRLGIAQAILNSPSLLILDEPFSGLDPISRIEIRTLFQDLKLSGTTILVASHVLSDLEHLCDRFIIIGGGNIKGIKELDEIKTGAYEILIPASTPVELLQKYQNINNFDLTLENDIFRLKFEDTHFASKTLKVLIEDDIKIIKFTPIEQPLEKLFIELNS